MTTKRKSTKGAKGAIRNRAAAPAGEVAGRPRTIGQAELVQALNTWRDTYNPLRGLTVARAVSMMEQAMTGAWSDLMWAYAAPLFGIESADADLYAIIERRCSKLNELDHSIKIMTDGTGKVQGDAALAKDQAQFLRAWYDRIGNLTEAIEHMELAAFRGFALMQPQQRGTYNLMQADTLELIEPWNLLRDGWKGDFYWNPEAKQTEARHLGAAYRIDPSWAVIRTVGRSVNRIALLKYIRTQLADKDWDAFVEIYGMNARIIIGPPNVAKEDEAKFEAAAEDVAEGGSGYLPHGSAVHDSEQARGLSPFEQRLRYLSEKLVLVGTGGLLTMLSAPGSGTLAGSAHMETFEIIARSEAKKISQVFQAQLDRRILAQAFPGKPVLAYFEIAANEDPDTGEVIKHVTELRRGGYRVSAAEVSEKTGYAVEDAPVMELGPQPAGPILNRKPITKGKADDPQLGAFLAAARMALAEGVQKDFEPVAAALQELLAKSETEDDNAFRARVAAFAKQLPDLAAQVLDNTAAERITNEILTAALAIGLEQGAAS